MVRLNLNHKSDSPVLNANNLVLFSDFLLMVIRKRGIIVFRQNINYSKGVILMTWKKVAKLLKFMLFRRLTRISLWNAQK